MEASTDPWAAVVGQPAAVAVLRAAASDPVHAFLVVGRPGWGTRALARALAGDLLAGGTDEPGEQERHRRLAAAERHPAMAVVERVGASVSVEQAREVVRLASLSPPEGTRRVILVTDLHLVDQAGPVLLKSIEEPPDSTFFVLLADEVPPELVTIASRCVRVDVGPVPQVDVVAALTQAGVPAEVAEAASLSSGGDLDRARLLAADPEIGARRAFWYGIPDRLDGSGARVAELVAEAESRVEQILAPLAARHDEEAAAVADDVERLGLPKGRLTEVEARHKREVRRARTDELRAGLATLAARYRDAVVADPGRSGDLERAGSAIGTLTRRLTFNPNERLALEALLVDLPALGG